jgi:RNA polymerase sigma-70 factor, ECF subfamily
MYFLSPYLFHNSRSSDLKMRSDEELAQEARHRSEAFAELYQRHLKAVYRYHFSRVGNVHDAEDLTAQTFLAAQESIASFQGRGKFVAWLMRVASRKMFDLFRRQRSMLPLEMADEIADKSIAPEEFAAQQLCLEQVAQSLSQLTGDRAEAIALQIFGGLNLTEVAQVMGKSKAAVKMLVSRALKDLRQHNVNNL